MPGRSVLQHAGPALNEIIDVFSPPSVCVTFWHYISSPLSILFYYKDILIQVTGLFEYMSVFGLLLIYSPYIIFIFCAVMNLHVLYYKSYKFMLICQDHADYSPFAFPCAF